MSKELHEGLLFRQFLQGKNISLPYGIFSGKTISNYVGCVVGSTMVQLSSVEQVLSLLVVEKKRISQSTLHKQDSVLRKFLYIVQKQMCQLQYSQLVEESLKPCTFPECLEITT